MTTVNPYRSTRCMPRLPHLPTSIIRSAKHVGSLAKEKTNKITRTRRRTTPTTRTKTITRKKHNNTNNKNNNNNKKNKNNNNNKNKSNNKKKKNNTNNKNKNNNNKNNNNTNNKKKNNTNNNNKNNDNKNKNKNNNNNEIWISCPAEVWNVCNIFYLPASIPQKPAVRIPRDCAPRTTQNLESSPVGLFSKICDASDNQLSTPGHIAT